MEFQPACKHRTESNPKSSSAVHAQSRCVLRPRVRVQDKHRTWWAVTHASPKNQPCQERAEANLTNQCYSTGVFHDQERPACRRKMDKTMLRVTLHWPILPDHVEHMAISRSVGCSSAQNSDGARAARSPTKRWNMRYRLVGMKVIWLGAGAKHPFVVSGGSAGLNRS